MGMPITIDVRDTSADAGVLDAIFADLRFVDALFSPFRDESVVSRINAGDPSTEASYYAPLLDRLPDPPGGRVEVPFTRSHWEAKRSASRMHVGTN